MLETSPRLGWEYRNQMKRSLAYMSSDFDEKAHKADIHVDLQSIDLPDGSLDVILTPHVLEHVPDTDKALSELNRVMVPGGSVLIQIPLLQGKTSIPAEPEYHGDDTLVYWRFGWDLTDRVRDHGFTCTALVPEDFRRRIAAGRTDWRERSQEFDVDSMVASARVDDLTVVSDDEASRRFGFEPSYMFVTWECVKR